MFWQGGFTFYSAVVVPIGGSVLRSEPTQGFITREVTEYLNLAGVVALAIWAWELSAEPLPRRLLSWSLWLVMAAALAALFWLHVRMDAHLDPDELRIHNRSGFRTLHRAYLILSTVQWVAALVLLGGTLRAWMKSANRPC